MPQPATSSLSAEDIQGRVLFRDGLVIALNKPSGMPVHAGFGGGPNLEESFTHLTFGLPRPPSLGHRLDRDTSGCLVLGRHRKALQKLSKLFAGGRVRKTYWAIVHGAPKRAEGRIDLALKKIGRGPGWKMKGDRSVKRRSPTTKYVVASRPRAAFRHGWSCNLTRDELTNCAFTAPPSDVLSLGIMCMDQVQGVRPKLLCCTRVAYLFPCIRSASRSKLRRRRLNICSKH